MADMSATPRIPTIKSAFDIIQRLSALDADAPREIAAHMLRIDNANRVDDNKSLNDPHLERMEYFLAGAHNVCALEPLFTSSAFLGRKMVQSDIDELMGGIGRYLSRHPDIAAKTGLADREIMPVRWQRGVRHYEYE